ncbi:MAG: hypothetical protein OXC83_05730 [Chloroflexi bacterium]|nr:hypothetical protein [Chloroflexota bacterium]
MSSANTAETRSYIWMPNLSTVSRDMRIVYFLEIVNEIAPKEIDTLTVKPHDTPLPRHFLR